MSKNSKLTTMISKIGVNLEHIDGDKYMINYSLLSGERIDNSNIRNIRYTFRGKTMYSNSNNILYLTIDEDTTKGEIIVLKHNLDKINKIIKEINDKYLPINLEEGTNEITASNSEVMPRLKFGTYPIAIDAIDTENLCSNR